MKKNLFGLFKIITRVLAAVMIVAMLFSYAPSTASVKTAVFFIPHQDDEMYMLGTMKRLIDEGSDVYVVLVTDGGGSRVRGVLKKNNEVILTRREFVENRNREFYRSMRAIGVESNHILFANDGSLSSSMNPKYQDSHLTLELASEVVEHYYSLLGNGFYATVEANGGHPDHQALHKALLSFIAIKDKKFYSEIVGEGESVRLTTSEFITKHKALAVYYEWNPKSHNYSVAKLSVRKLLDAWNESPYEYTFDN